MRAKSTPRTTGMLHWPASAEVEGLGAGLVAFVTCAASASVWLTAGIFLYRLEYISGIGGSEKSDWIEELFNRLIESFWCSEKKGRGPYIWKSRDRDLFDSCSNVLLLILWWSSEPLEWKLNVPIVIDTELICTCNDEARNLPSPKDLAVSI
jgi:hypothetical protein